MAKTPRKTTKAIADTKPQETAKTTQAASRRAIERISKRVSAGEERLVTEVRSDGPNASVTKPLHGMTQQEMDLRLIDGIC